LPTDSQEHPPTPRPLTAKSSLHEIAFGLGAALFLGTLVLSLAGLAARWSALAEISTHFRVWYALGAVVATILLAAGLRWRWAAAGLLVLVWHAAGIVPWYLPSPPANASGPEIVLLSANVNADNRSYDRFLALVAAEKPDIIFIQELSPSWAAALDALRVEYPHYVLTARTDYFGLGLYSRYPLENVQTEDPVKSDVPVIRADAMIEGRKVHLINVHLAPPEGAVLTQLRYKQYAWMNGYAASLDGPVIAAGDFNCAVWSPLYRDLARAGRFENARRGRGMLASWFPLPGGQYLIPIDQILGAQLQFTRAKIGAPIGSDHAPMVAGVRLLQ